MSCLVPTLAQAQQYSVIFGQVVSYHMCLTPPSRIYREGISTEKWINLPYTTSTWQTYNALSNEILSYKIPTSCWFVSLTCSNPGSASQSEILSAGNHRSSSRFLSFDDTTRPPLPDCACNKHNLGKHHARILGVQPFCRKVCHNQEKRDMISRIRIWT